MLVLTDMQRAYLRKLRALSKDSQGNEVFVGLTLEESTRFNFLSESLMKHEYRTPEALDEYLSFRLRHEHHRLQVYAEVEAQQCKSASH
ncbi:hypothetical protein [Pseudomonas sp. MPC6]|uniref:hypothetical protein n=1 Tax=unclassified Pseudomonas TaxID=196821 RepID=UPI001110CD3D|nr:hypothetical protein [Pseudomonas sp. MPC6]QCY09488.1 hypothetical protein ELQ88_01220 [Pseudomonas sp. MPC6]